MHSFVLITSTSIRITFSKNFTFTNWLIKFSTKSKANKNYLFTGGIKSKQVFLANQGIRVLNTCEYLLYYRRTSYNVHTRQNSGKQCKHNIENYAKWLIATKTERLVTAKEERKITKIAMTNCQTLQDKIKGIKMIFDKSRKNFRRWTRASVGENKKLHKRLELYYNVVEFDAKKYFLPNNPPEIYVVHL